MAAERTLATLVFAFLLHLPCRSRAHALRRGRSGTHPSLSGEHERLLDLQAQPKYTTGTARKVSRNIDEDVRDQVRALANTEAFQLPCRERKKVEMRFAHMKRIFKLDRLRLRGLSGARDEVLLPARVQNLRRLAKLICRDRQRLPGVLRKRHVASGVGARALALRLSCARAETSRDDNKHSGQASRRPRVLQQSEAKRMSDASALFRAASAFRNRNHNLSVTRHS
jgi:hypothetical protein